MALHAAMRAAVDEVLPVVSGARACGRALGLKRHLGWQVYTVAHTSDHATVIRALPKARGWKLVMQALAEVGCTHAVLGNLQAAADRLRKQLQASLADRATVRAVAAGALDSAAQHQEMRRMRAEGTDANAYLHGIRVETCLSAFMVGPVGPKHVIDLAAVTSLHGVHRTRPGSPWPLHCLLEAYDDQRARRGVVAGKYRGTGIPPLVKPLSSAGVERDCLRMRKDGDTQVVELLDAGPRRAEAMHFAFMECLRSAGTAGASPSQSRLMYLMNTPTDRAVVEVWFHESVRLVNDPSGMLMSSPSLNRRVLTPQGMERLPLECVAVPIDRPTLPGALRKHQEAHEALLARAAKELGAPMSAFRGFQLDVPNPPWMSMLAMAFDC